MMLKEKLFVIFCFLISTIGIFVMYIADKMVQPKWVKINQISENENYIIFNATIISIKRAETATFIKAKDETGVIDVVVFGNTINTSFITVGMNVTIIGKPEKYKGKMEVLPSKILR
ncbi:MAG: OB-fold nucleic acid binding domain-containing protein [Candidatus Aenigmarchaeota archaeon]|nr:OB-fold nucleic acid binding domain-containing protein [Candidatus Aenigmarchaeota archaeon]